MWNFSAIQSLQIFVMGLYGAALFMTSHLMLYGMPCLMRFLTYVLAQSGPSPLLIQSVDVTKVLGNPGLEMVVGGTTVGFPIVGVSPGDGVPVHHIVHYAANPWENSAGFRLFLWKARTCILLLGCCSIIVTVVVVTIQNFIIVPGNFPLHVVHAPVMYLVVN